MLGKLVGCHIPSPRMLILAALETLVCSTIFAGPPRHIFRPDISLFERPDRL